MIFKTLHKYNTKLLKGKNVDKKQYIVDKMFGWLGILNTTQSADVLHILK